MIARLSGVLEDKAKDEVVIDVGGVGYRIFCSAQTLSCLPALQEPVSVRIRTLVREDAIDLYGFAEQAEEAMFMLLTSVSHIGPKLALGILSGIAIDELCAALNRGDVARLTHLHGVGKKTAERLVLELKDKVAAMPATSMAMSLPSVGTAAPMVPTDVVSALVNLGYKENKARAAVLLAVDSLGEGAGLEALLKESLRHCRR
ncbi:MAG: Holliday junction branch migration protein RuvA [Proteobacteria bacterium]|nr:Holliday junction branch migration protein RuvA [Cystobacterineae bacterium]MCL2259605.1 Holliday junction branch migration protein RuvA [Cystobacterineae bacterium]MCL2313928.1 Holliday junction branch migration protein RuvA [Pseudomonadota bacterium]